MEPRAQCQYVVRFERSVFNGSTWQGGGAIQCRRAATTKTPDGPAMCSQHASIEKRRLAEVFVVAAAKTDRTKQLVQLRPITRDAAKAWIRSTHRHLPTPPVGDLYRVALSDGAQLVAVGMAGRPSARMLQDGRTVEILRIAAATEPTKNACTRLYGALRRAGENLGYVRFVTYTLESEPGTSLRAAGFYDDGLTDGGEWSCPSRPRDAVQQPCRKRRWIWPGRTSGLWNNLKPLEAA